VITFNSETTFNLQNEANTTTWIESVVVSEGFVIGEINYIFCDDLYLNHINKEFLKHDFFTDIISFDYSLGKQINGDIYISIERVLDNAEQYNVTFENELRRVMIHGVLHYMGYKDKTTEEKKVMRLKENTSIDLLNIYKSGL
jgi:probable rRNA maturation factor